MKRKIISLILVFAALFVSNPYVYAKEKTDCDEAVEFLSRIGVIKNEVSDINETVTRENFAVYIARIIKTDENGVAEKRYFRDVESSGFAAVSINSLTDIGIISKNNENLFYPTQNITLYDACKMLVCALGYEPYAQMRGGYPLGYVKTAKQLGIIDHVTSGELTYASAFNMLYKSMTVEMYEINGIIGDSFKYTAESKNTLLSLYFDIYETIGTVEVVPGANIENASILSENEIVVDNIRYNIVDGNDYSDYIGDYCRVFYETNEPESEMGRNLIFISKYKQKLENIKISEKLFIDYEGKEFSYYKTEDSIKPTTIVMESPTVLYNGFPLETDVTKTLSQINKGTLELKDSDSDGEYDILLVWDYTNFVVEYVNASDRIIYNKLKGLPINLQEYDVVSFFEEGGGKTAEFSTIKSGDVLSVAESKNKKVARIIISTGKVHGTMDSVSVDEEITINGKKYFVDKSYFNVFKNDYSAQGRFTCLGKMFYFSFDCFGNIAYIDEEYLGMNFGYAVACAYSDSAFEKDVMLKVLTQDNKFEILTCADKLTIDGEKYKTDTNDIIVAFGNKNKFKPQLIRYSTNADGEINKIDTIAFVSEYENDNDAMQSVYETVTEDRWYQSGRMGIKGVLTSDTKVFFVPADIENANDDEFVVGHYTEFFIADNTYTTEVYVSGAQNCSADAVVCSFQTSDYSKNSSNQSMLVFDEYYETLNEDGELVKVVTGYENGSVVTYNVPEDISLDGIERGDIIKFHFNLRKEIIKSYNEEPDVLMLYDCSKGGMPDSDVWKGITETVTRYDNTGWANTGYYRSNFQLSFGYVSKKSSDVVCWGYKSPQQTDEAALVSNIKIIVYDKNKREDQRLYIGTIHDVEDYDSVGENASVVIYQTRVGVGKCMVVYK